MKPTQQTIRPYYFGTDSFSGFSCIGPSREGRSHELAGYAVITRLVDAVLVHGSIRVPGCIDPAAPHDHAWVALADGHVWEPTRARLWDAGLFWSVMQPVVANTYTHAELLEISTCTDHWGPWR